LYNGRKPDTAFGVKKKYLLNEKRQKIRKIFAKIRASSSGNT